MMKRRTERQSPDRGKDKPPSELPTSETEPIAPRTSPSPVAPLIAKSVYESATYLIELNREDQDRRFWYPASAVDEVIPFLRAVLEGDEIKALTTLEDGLEFAPSLIWNPIVRDQIEHLFSLLLYHGPQEFYDRVIELMVELVRRWAKGMTLGYNVSITRPKGRRGQSPLLFPHLEETEGFFESNRAFFDRNAASSLWKGYDDLMDRLKRAVEWRRVRREYQEFLQNQRDPTPVVEEVAADIRDAFESFARDQRFSGEPLSNQTLRKMVLEGLAVRRGGDPRHKIACGLLGSVDLVMRGTVLRTSPSLIESTLKTLRKHGIGERSRPSRSQSAKRKLRRFSL